MLRIQIFLIVYLLGFDAFPLGRERHVLVFSEQLGNLDVVTANGHAGIPDESVTTKIACDVR